MDIPKKQLSYELYKALNKVVCTDEKAQMKKLQSEIDSMEEADGIEI